MKANNNADENPTNMANDSNIWSFINVSGQTQSHFYSDPRVDQNAYPLPPQPQPPGLNPQMPQPNRDVHLGHFDPQGHQELGQQTNNFQNTPQRPTVQNNPNFPFPSTNMNTSANNDQFLNDIGPKLINDISQMDESFQEFNKNLLLSLESNQQNAQDQNPPAPTPQQFPSSHHQSQPQQSQSYSLAKKAAPEEYPVSQNFGNDYSNAQAQLLQNPLSGSQTSIPPILPFGTQADARPHNTSVEIRDNIPSMTQMPVSNRQLPQSSNSLENMNSPLHYHYHQQQVQSPLTFQNSPSVVMPPEQVPNRVTNIPNIPPLAMNNPQTLPTNAHLHPSVLGQQIQDVPLSSRSHAQLFHQAPVSQNANQSNQHPLWNQNQQPSYQNQQQSYPSQQPSYPIQQSPYPSQPQSYLNQQPQSYPSQPQSYLNQQPQSYPSQQPQSYPSQQPQSYPSQQPQPYPSEHYPAHPNPQNPNYFQHYQNWPQQAPMHMPGQYQHGVYYNLPNNYPPSQMPNYPQDNNYPHHQTPINNNLQNHNFHNHSNYPPPGYPHHYPQGFQPNSQTNLDNQRNLKTNNNISPSFPRQQENQAWPHNQGPGQYAQTQPQHAPQNPSQKIPYKQDFSQGQRNNDSVHDRSQNSGNQSFNQPHTLPSDNLILEQKRNHIPQKLPTPPTHESFDDSPDTSSYSSNRFKNPVNSNRTAQQSVQPTTIQVKRPAPPPYSKIPFDPKNIIHFIQYSEGSENGVIVEKYLLSDAELIRFGGLISKKEKQSLIRSDAIDGIVVDFKKLANIKAKFIGAFGRPKALFKALADNSLIAHNEISFFESHFLKSGSGLYLLPISKEKEETLILLILYSKDDRDFDKVDEKRSYIRLLRYLTQLCSTNILAISEKDVALISSEEGKKAQNFFIYKPQANKLTEDVCEIVDGKIIEGKADSKSLIATSSHSGFYTKSYYPPKTEIIEGTHDWRNKYTYDRAFDDCIVNVDKLDNTEIDTMYTFLRDHFYEKFRIFQEDLPHEINRLEELHSNAIDHDVAEKIKAHKTLYAVKCMKIPGMLEYKWLEQALHRNRIKDAEVSSRIAAALNETIPVGSTVKANFGLIKDSIFRCYLFETEMIAMKQILADRKISGFDHDYRAVEEFQARTLSADTLQRAKENIYNEVIEKINKDKNVVTKLITSWNFNTLSNEIHGIRSCNEFFDKNSEACMMDAIMLFKLFYDKVGDYFSSAAAEADARKHHRSQLESKAKKKLLCQAIKNCLEKKEGKLIVDIIDLKKSYYGNYQLKYRKENIIEAYNEFSVWQYELRKSELDDARNNDNFILCPTSKPVTTFQLPDSFELVSILFMKGNKLAAVVNSQGRSELRFYNTARANDVLFSRPFGQILSKMDYNENKKKIAFCTKQGNEVNLYIYAISDDFHVRNEASIDLTARFGIADVHLLCLGNKNEIFVDDNQGNIRSIDYRNQTAKKLNVAVQSLKSMFLVPGANCLLLITSTAVIPYIVDNDKVLPEISLKSGAKLDNLVITKFDSQVQLLFKSKGNICNKLLKCVLSTEDYKLVECNMEESQTNTEQSHVRSLFDYFGYVYAKFSVHSPMEGLNQQSFEQTLLIYCSHLKGHNEQQEEKISKKLKEIQNNINKPYSAKLGLHDNAVFILASEDHSQLLHSKSDRKPLDRWIQELVSLVPIQIGRTENNQYIILKDGQPLQLSEARNVYEVKKRIFYGLVEAILNNWHKPIKVISSMGKQSTGKSYTLNHLSGATFAIAGGRCTDGCWLTLKITDECLYVLMDFEGLGSFERSEQEDMLLSIKNAALSNITLYKTAFSLDKDTDQMFYRFNQGANLLKGDDKIFKGLFCLLVKDVDKKDIKEVTTEFKTKMNKIIERGERKDFITTMYGGGFGINAFDFFQNKMYYTQMEELATYIRYKVQSSFTNGKDFLNLLKTIQAKLAIQDFTSLSRQDIDTRIYILSENYINAFMLGNLADQKNSRSLYVLKSYDDGENVIEESMEAEIEGDSEKPHKIFYSDPDINLMSESRDFIDVLNKSFPKTEENHVAWSRLLRDFAKAAVKKRTIRVLIWVDVNLEKWAQVEDFQELIANFKQLVGHKAKEIEMRYQICLNDCASCFAACTLLNSHTDNHTCGLADHMCKNVCAYCKDNNINEPCSLKFGHNERHMCSNYSHTCGRECKYYKCQGKCVQTTNHKGPHKCGLLQHVCPEQCSLSSCSNRCQISADKEHSIHKCINDQCSKNCEVQGCRNRCECSDHFHGYDNLSKQFKIENGIDLSRPNFITSAGKEINIDFHCCGITHPCGEDCSESGFCKVIVERKVVKEEFKGKKGQFSYQKQFENIGNKIKCCKVIPEYQKTHDGNHVHSLDPATVHVCETRCPTCNNICEKQTGHPGKHNTAHGNMEKCYFVSNQTDIDVGDHKYVVGESAVAEMCHMFCKSLGRGHIHLVECGHTKDACPNRDEGKRRHETCQYGPDVNVSKDEVLHEVYWDLINFEDPCQKVDVDEYSKCPFYCGSKDHEKDKDKKYCQLKLWHNKVNNLSETGKTQGYVSKDGHYFECTHSQNTKGYHFVFCLDDSGSMSGAPWADLSAAVRDFCSSRATSTTDRLSIVTFNTTPRINCENLPFSQFNAAAHLVFRSGGTCFAPAITLCHQLFKRTFNKDMIPVFVFMSDGGNTTGDAEMTNLNTEFAPNGLKVFAIGFGSIQTKLKQLADLVKGTYSTSINGVALRDTFMEISSQFGTIISVAPSKK